MTDRLDQLERLGRLRDQGLLTEEEFAREKAQPLAGGEATAARPADPATDTSTGSAEGPVSPPKQASSSATAASVESPENPLTDDLKSTLRAISGVSDASQQVSRVWAVAALLIGGEVISEIGRVSQSMAARSWTSSVSMGDELLTSAIGLTVSTVVVGLLGLWIARRASRVGVVILGLLTLSAVIWPFVSAEPMRLVLKLGSAALAALALWYLVGVARGAFWLAGRRLVPSGPAKAEATNWKDASARGRAAAAPIRKIIGWVALGWLGLFLIGGAWFWLSTRDNDPIARSTAQYQAQIGPQAQYQQPALPVTTAALVGWWVAEGERCASGAAIQFEGDGGAYGSGAEGSWTLAGGRLTILIQEIDMDTEQLVGPVYETSGSIQLVAPNEFHLSDRGGLYALPAVSGGRS